MKCNFQPLKKDKPKPVTAEVIRRLLEFVDSSKELDLWLPFPQNQSSFAFSSDNKPLPVGTLIILWKHGEPFVRTCPECGDSAYMISFGGLLSNGGGHLVCTGCNQSYFQHIGGLGTVSNLLRNTPLQETEFRPSTGFLGAAKGSDGKELMELLGVKGKPEFGEPPELYLKDSPELREWMNKEQ